MTDRRPNYGGVGGGAGPNGGAPGGRRGAPDISSRYVSVDNSSASRLNSTWFLGTGRPAAIRVRNVGSAVRSHDCSIMIAESFGSALIRIDTITSAFNDLVT